MYFEKLFLALFQLSRLFWLRDGDSASNGSKTSVRVLEGESQNTYNYDHAAWLRGPSGPFVESDYYVSVNPSAWNQAEQDCHHIFEGTGREGGLLSIETEAELKFIRLTLERFGSGKKYWTSGLYDEAWIWASDGLSVPSFALPPLTSGATPSEQDRLIINTINRFKSSFQVLQDSQPQRYICEVKRDLPPPPENCNQHSDSLSKCISSPLGCSFCAMEGYSGPRCDTVENLINKGCGKDDQSHICRSGGWEKPSFYININGGTRSYPSTETQSFCPNTALEVSATFNLGTQPLDVYVLMDFSESMRDDQTSVAQLAKSLVSRIKELSADYRIGFGTFVDKPVRDFGADDDYSFINVLPLTTDSEKFKSAVAGQAIKSGGDRPESQFDGIYQAAECTEKIGWRSDARHILLVMTDDDFHHAPQGIEKGLIPFNGQCSLDSIGKYDKETIYDYPSTEQIVNVLRKNQVVPIFAVTESAQGFYTPLLSKITPSALGILGSDSSNVIQLLVEQYKKIEGRIELENVGDTDPSLKIRYFSTCNGPTLQETNVCEDIGPDGRVLFKVLLEMGSCREWGRDRMKTIRIQAKGLPIGFDIPVKLYCKYK